MASKDDHLVYHVQRDWCQAPLDDQERAILHFVGKLNFHPAEMTERDAQALRETGLDDRAMLDVVLITATFNFMNRLADGLGIHAEEAFRAAQARGERRVDASARNGPPDEA